MEQRAFHDGHGTTGVRATSLSGFACPVLAARAPLDVASNCPGSLRLHLSGDRPGRKRGARMRTFAVKPSVQAHGQPRASTSTTLRADRSSGGAAPPAHVGPGPTVGSRSSIARTVRPEWWADPGLRPATSIASTVLLCRRTSTAKESIAAELRAMPPRFAACLRYAEAVRYSRCDRARCPLTEALESEVDRSLQKAPGDQ
jgi:hypothetical protein